MTSGGEAQRRATAWLYIALLLGDRAIVAVRLSEDAISELQDEHHHGLEELGPKGDEMMKTLEKAFDQGVEVEAKLTCPQIQEHLANATSQVTKDLNLVCIQGQCDFTKLNVDQLLVSSGPIASLVASADNKKCLPKVFGSQVVQDRLGELLAIVPLVLHAAPTQEGRARVRETYLQLVSYQEGLLGLAPGLADRQTLVGFEIQGEDCPSPCQMCDHHESGGFAFRCLLKGGDKNRLPEVAGGVTCDIPKRRWLRRFPFSRQCRVNDWKEAALQHLHVSAMLTCASITMTMGVNALMTQSQRREMQGVCLKMEQAYALTDDETDAYKAQLLAEDEIVPRGLKLAVNTILLFGLAAGLAGLRAATRGNGRLTALLEGGQAMNAVDFSAAFAAYIESTNLTVRSIDRDMYGDQELRSRHETLRVLDACEDVYGLKTQNTFAEGSAPLMILAMTMRNDNEHGSPGNLNGEATDGVSWGQTLGAVVGTIFAGLYASVLTFYFFSYGLVFRMSGPEVWIAAVALGVWGIYELAFAFFGLFFRNSQAEQRLEQCLAIAEG